ncbi:hypothetical protein BDV98DRAFT_78961 [Pterulicium gracile]|uniref:Uncharacterized protein n=1 Tax=Pterulicium gracile TaxID=1884261 RepID=A0A5C3QLM9_9AGAR|nr:hypothetical protein BDV98DRAFT_78961 [Pterula gracilis]
MVREDPRHNDHRLHPRRSQCHSYEKSRTYCPRLPTPLAHHVRPHGRVHTSRLAQEHSEAFISFDILKCSLAEVNALSRVANALVESLGHLPDSKTRADYIQPHAAHIMAIATHVGISIAESGFQGGNDHRRRTMNQLKRLGREMYSLVRMELCSQELLPVVEGGTSNSDIVVSSRL